MAFLEQIAEFTAPQVTFRQSIRPSAQKFLQMEPMIGLWWCLRVKRHWDSKSLNTNEKRPYNLP
jgi:hypothetical protein